MQASIPRPMQAVLRSAAHWEAERAAGLYRTSAGFVWLGLADEVRVGERRLLLACELHAMY